MAANLTTSPTDVPSATAPSLAASVLAGASLLIDGIKPLLAGADASGGATPLLSGSEQLLSGTAAADAVPLGPDWVLLAVKSCVAVACCILFIPLFFVLVKTGAMHRNCRILLLLASGCQQCMLATQVAMFGFDWLTNNRMPEDEEGEIWGCDLHEVAYFAHTYLSLLLVLERLVATRRAPSYEDIQWPVYRFVVAFVLGLVAGGGFAYVVHHRGEYIPAIWLMAALETLVAALCLLTYCYSRLKKNQLPVGLVAGKYQLVEVHKFTQAMLGPVLISATIKFLALIPPSLLKARVIEYPLASTLFFGVQALNCVAFKALLIVSHRRFRATFARYFCICRKVQVHPQPQPRQPDDETAAYFNQLKQSWDAPLPRQ